MINFSENDSTINLSYDDKNKALAYIKQVKLQYVEDKDV